MTAHFHPQRLLPRYAGLVSRTAQLPRGLPVSMALLGRLVNSSDKSATENPTPLELDLARVVVCGFPRTGTTFLQAAIQDAFEDPTACWKNHDVLAIPRYLNAGIPTVITLRDPLSTAISWSIYNSDQPTEKLLAARIQTYSVWHEQALRYLGSRLLRLKRFEDFREHPFETLSPVLQRIAREEELHHIDSEFVECDLEHRNAEQGISSRQGNTPSILRVPLRNQYLALTDSSRVRTAMDRATAVYGELTALSLERPIFDLVGSDSIAHAQHRIAVPVTLTGAVATGALGAAMLLRVLGD